MLLVLKSVIVGVVAWTLAEYVVASPQPTYAPFTALLIVQSTVYRSLLQSVQYVGAVVIGVFGAGVVEPVVGENIAAFAVMLFVSLLVGRWHRLGSQGLQVAVAGVFAYHAMAGAQLSMLWQIITMVLLGAGVALVVNLLLLPPVRYRTATEGLGELSLAIRTLLQDMSDGLSEGLPERDTVADWLRRARELDRSVSKARYAIEVGAESLVYNPRRLVRRKHTTSASFVGYRTLVEALSRAGEQIRSICYGLLRTYDSQGLNSPDNDFLCPYAQLLGAVAETASEIGEANDEDNECNPFHRTLDQGRQRHKELTEHVRNTSAWPSHTALLTDADRLLEEFSYAHVQGAVTPPRVPQ